MRLIVALAIGLAVPAGSVGQTLTPGPPAVQHVTVAPSVHPSEASPGEAVTLSVEVIPKPGMHVYAAGAEDFTPVSLVMTPVRGIVMGRPAYPEVEPGTTLTPMADPAPAYHARFRISQPITLMKTVKSGARLRLSGAVNYQACDDRLCYPSTSIPVFWTLTVR